MLDTRSVKLEKQGWELRVRIAEVVNIQRENWKRERYTLERSVAKYGNPKVSSPRVSHLVRFGRKVIVEVEHPTCLFLRIFSL